MARNVVGGAKGLRKLLIEDKDERMDLSVNQEGKRSK